MAKNLIPEIVKIPQIPKYGQKYWTISFQRTHKPYPLLWCWNGNEVDYMVYNLGLIYKTIEECEKNLKKDYERLTGKKWSWGDD